MEAGPSKKRKVRDDDEEEDEELKMEKFFALVKNIREARDRLLNGSNALNGTGCKRKGKKVEEEKQIPVWKPSFRREDFMEEAVGVALSGNPPVTFLGSSQTEEAQKEKNEEDLDLRLSL
ncbi:hypothetical protein CJ030_MR8G020271 [Morella rubra]|uniref:Protein NIM1-INTERACTING 1 n=1 Tax=Morella rubra TaxID=262757 RepID=A0A6A1UQV3_9ROSI|nr:hypothetical protein CJ030_MR8G020271 [Morella rubra]